MKPSFLDLFAPRCHRCDGTWILEGRSNSNEPVLHGWLRCSNAACDARAPVIDGVPVLTHQPEVFLTANAAAWLRRLDIPPDIDEVLNAATGVNSWSDAPRQQLSTYAWDHYGDLDPEAHDEVFRPGAVLRLLDEALSLLPAIPEGLALDAGCATGRTTLHLAARTGGPVLGVDLIATFLCLAHRVVNTGRIKYDLRRNGLAYSRREYEVSLPAMQSVDFWMADAAQLPLASGSLSLITALNVLDSCVSPTAMLREFARTLRPGGYVLVCTPFDWSSPVTAVDQWLGGTPGRPDPASFLLAELVAAGLEIVAKHEGHPWTLRLHDRSAASYHSMIVAARQPG